MTQALDEAEEPGESAPLLPDDIEMYLCFLKDDARGGTSCETWKVTDWIKKYGDNADTDFVFLSYTRKQFCVATEQELAGWTLPDAETRAAYVEMARRDRATLHEYGIKAAQSAGMPAFWLDFECIRDADNQAKATSQSADVYRICDIVRAAHSMAILLGPPLLSRLPGAAPQTYSPASANSWLREWGTRLWTLPEILLCSPEHRVRIHALGGPPRPEQPAKRNFAARAWRDAKLIRQLIDHYESSVHLTPLELVSLALEAFAARQTALFAPGDLSYALMGLLRRRPAVVASDTSFEAFARLSLANDSDALLERLLCLLPPRRGAAWHELRDAWGARLWDVQLRCQVAGIVDDGTVTLDGAVGAAIQWDAVDQVAFFKRPTLARTFGKILLRGVPLYLIFGLVFTIVGGVLKAKIDASNRRAEEEYGSDESQSTAQAIGLLVPGIVFLVPSALIALAAPAMLLDIYRGKFWSTQALFVGVEGLVDIGEAERYLFGFNHGRLKWSTNGSTLSRHHLKDGECVPLPPAVERGKKDGQTLFTLIDTYAMTATCFYAERPPVAVMICGQEGGMQRAVLCSYDWRTQTFARETVLRMKTLVLDRMFRVDRFRFALRRRAHDDDAELLRVADHESSGLFNDQDSKPGTGAKHWTMWKIDLALIPFMSVSLVQIC
ncbi:hypothetical protein GTA08_BOTSDO00421 [Neofusicoccum parvum]|uniref:Uncharacterized protein n=1 Tax=Neofusicoccum parvum TaxID=310453 RepID=A0ACB5S9Q0_9PEZI|nr:hypothetical protein GTA08_BOTSDO00421 [Neofusicoccum parvum]